MGALWEGEHSCPLFIADPESGVNNPLQWLPFSAGIMRAFGRWWPLGSPVFLGNDADPVEP